MYKEGVEPKQTATTTKCAFWPYLKWIDGRLSNSTCEWAGNETLSNAEIMLAAGAHFQCTLHLQHVQPQNQQSSVNHASIPHHSNYEW